MGKGNKNKSSSHNKVRYDGVDVAAMVSQLQRDLLGRRVVNIYDGISDNESYLFKLDGNDKPMLFVESGIRFHTTKNSSTLQSSDGMPSSFCMKLRKHLRSLRLESIVQLGNYDRVVTFLFGSGTNRHCIILELYAKGNIILTNKDYEILALLRSHEYSDNTNNDNNDGSDGGVKVRVGHVYPVTYATSIGTASFDTPSSNKNSNDDNDDETKNDNNNSSNEQGILSCTNENDVKQWIMSQLQPSPSNEPDDNNDDNKDVNNNNSNNKKKQGKGGGGKGGKNKKDSSNSKKNNNNNVIPLKGLLLRPSSGVYHYGPSLLEHCILYCNLDPNMKLSADLLSLSINNENEKEEETTDWLNLVNTLRNEGKKILDKLKTDDMKGYILYRPSNSTDNKESTTNDDKTNATSNDKNDKHDDKILEEFQPHLLKQHEGRLHLTYETFSNAVDDFFYHIGKQRLTIRAENAEAAAKVKLEKIQNDQKRRIQSLLDEQDKLRIHAQLVEINAENVDNALMVINSALNSGMDWESLNSLVQVEKDNNNPVAMLIKKLDLQNDSMILSLPDTISSSDDDENDDDSDDGNKKIKNVDISISLNETAHGNARIMFAKYRSSKEKSQKTIEASTKVLKAAELTAQRQLAEAQKHKKLALHQSTNQYQRKTYWYEKFHWFITSDNYLVIGGKDAQQNELLVKRYLRKGDAYLHADVHGASSCILRAKRTRAKATAATTAANKSGGGGGKTEVIPLSDQALREAGNFTICLSSAWTSRMVTSAWWVESHQVSKTAPSGEYLTVGSFMVRGKKNFLPPTQLEMGLAILFRLGDDDSIARHKNERRDFALMNQDDDGDLFLNNDVDNTMGSKMNDGFVAVSKSKKEEKNEDKTQSNTTSLEDDIPPLADEEQQEDVPTVSEDTSADGSKAVDGTTMLTSDSTENESKSNGEGNSVEKIDMKTDSKPGEVNGEDAPENSKEGQKRPKKKGLSVRDRKLIKKYGSLEEAEIALREQEKEQQQRSEAARLKEATAETTKDKTNVTQEVVKRGKKSKMKKIKSKYDDQDDEDRELAMLALQGGEKKKQEKKRPGSKQAAAASKSQQKASADTAALLVKDSSEVAERLPSAVQQILAECVTVKSPENNDAIVRWDKFDADILEQVIDLEAEEIQLAAANRLFQLKQGTRIDNFSASLAGIIRTIKKHGHQHFLEITPDVNGAADDTGARRKTKDEKVKEKEAWKETLAQEGIAEDDEAEDAVDDTVEISKLTGKPQPEDTLLYAIPVCAPYQTLSKYKYKVKLTPGNLKRGKATKQCLEMFLKGGDGSDKKKGSVSTSDQNMKDLIKRVPENDWVHTICANVKISAAGASKMAKQQKKSGGKKKKK